MNDSKLKSLVTEAVELDRQTNLIDSKLKVIKALLTAEAKLRADDATKTEGGGTSVTFEGLDGCIARITKAGRTLKSSIKDADEDTAKIRKACNGFFARLFEQTLTFCPVKDFRDQAEDSLGKEAAAKLVKLMTNSGKTTVSFETKEIA